MKTIFLMAFSESIKYKIVMFLLLVTFNLSAQIDNIVKEFHLVEGQVSEQKFIDKYEKNTNTSVIGYVNSLKMKRAQYTMFPLRKMKHFKNGKQVFESLIKKEPKNIHLRYLRLFIQEKTPSFLDYKINIQEDKSILKEFLKKHSTNILCVHIKKNTTL